MAVTAASLKSRISSIDAWRGAVMIIMALDHVRDFFHADAQLFQPEDLTRTSAILFFTRWITHFCAPVFMFSAGMGAFLWVQRGRTTGQLAAYLTKRGLWLVLLELTGLRFAMFFTLSGAYVITVLWALGWSMIVLAVAARLPVRVLAALSVAVIALHNLADPVSAAQFGWAGWIWNILHQPGNFQVGGVIIHIAYPLVPWVAVMSAGFCFGRIVLLPAPDRRRWMIRLGLGLTASFLVIRGINVYGDPLPWSTAFPGMTVLSFLKCTKYPPSLDYLLMTLGPAILALAWLDGVTLPDTNPLIVFGRVPLFFFLVHFYLAHFLAVALRWLRFGAEAFRNTAQPAKSGCPLWGVYVAWIVVVALLYPVCLWYMRLKARKRSVWMSYL